VDAAGCAHFDDTTAKMIMDQMGHTDGGPAQNFLYNWTVSALVISVDLDAIAQGGKLLAIWGTTSIAGKPLDRLGLPFVKNTLLGYLRSQRTMRVASGAKNSTGASSDFSPFIADFQKSLAFQDSLDGKCGNQLLAESTESATRYRALAKLFCRRSAVGEQRVRRLHAVLRG